MKKFEGFSDHFDFTRIFNDFEEATGFGVLGIEYRAGFTALGEGRGGVETQSRLLLVRAVAFVTGLGQHGAHVGFKKVQGLGGRSLGIRCGRR